MLKGFVKLIVPDRGIGFIAQGKEEIYFHFSTLQGDFFDDLTAGDEVEFEAEPICHGFQATEVRRLKRG